MKKRIVLFISIYFLLISCSSGNLENVKANAPKIWKENNLEIAGYQGYQWGKLGFGTNYGGAMVWYRLKNIPDNGIIYEGALQRWGNEYHVYDFRAIDAIKPKGNYPF